MSNYGLTTTIVVEEWAKDQNPEARMTARGFDHEKPLWTISIPHTVSDADAATIKRAWGLMAEAIAAAAIPPAVETTKYALSFPPHPEFYAPGNVNAPTVTTTSQTTMLTGQSAMPWYLQLIEEGLEPLYQSVYGGYIIDQTGDLLPGLRGAVRAAENPDRMITGEATLLEVALVNRETNEPQTSWTRLASATGWRNMDHAARTAFLMQVRQSLGSFLPGAVHDPESTEPAAARAHLVRLGERTVEHRPTGGVLRRGGPRVPAVRPSGAAGAALRAPGGAAGGGAPPVPAPNPERDALIDRMFQRFLAPPRRRDTPFLTRLPGEDEA